MQEGPLLLTRLQKKADFDKRTGIFQEKHAERRNAGVKSPARGEFAGKLFRAYSIDGVKACFITTQSKGV